MSELSEEDLRRVKLVRVGVREVLTYLHGQKNLPHYVSLNIRPLPEGFRVLGATPAHFGGSMFYEFIVQHPSFDVVPYDKSTPVFNDDGRWYMYALASKEEVDARDTMSPIDIASGVLQSSWRDRPSLL